MNRNIVLKLIVFDLGGTVFSKGKQAFIDLLTEQLNTNREKVVSVIDGPHALVYRRNEMSASDYWQIVRKELNVPEKLGNLEKLWFNQYAPIPGMPNLVAELRKHYKVAYLSNNTPAKIISISSLMLTDLSGGMIYGRFFSPHRPPASIVVALEA